MKSESAAGSLSQSEPSESGWYLVHAQVISERQVLVAVPANMRDGVWSLSLTEQIARRKLRGHSWGAQD